MLLHYDLLYALLESAFKDWKISLPESKPPRQE
jgi:hypothetical protein